VKPIVLAVLWTLPPVGGFLIGLRFFRLAEPPSGATIEEARRFGRLLMMGAAAWLLFLGLIAVIIHGDLLVFAWRAIR
jgi:hypothetical protein